MTTDAFEMVLVHRLFRTELGWAPRLIGGVEPGQRARVNQVAGHVANVLAALHHHHLAEDERLWPILHARMPLRSNDIQRMQTEHAFIAKSVAIVELLLADWVAATEARTSELVTQSRATDLLVAEIKTLTQLVSDHLSAEEELMVPLINENITDAEWRAVTEQGAAFIGHNPRFALAFVGMVLQECTADERRRFLVGMPAPQRLLVRLFARRAAAGYHARLQRA